MKPLTILVLALFFLIRLNAQQNRVSGKVTDQTGAPLSGATVTIRGTTISTITDSLGTFQFTSVAGKNRVVVVSYVGYQTREYPINAQNNLTITLTQDVNSLNSVIVVGYGTQRKRDVTGATSTVASAEITKRPLTRVEQALQGTVSGVSVQSNSGQPGNGLSIRIRGANSITGSNEPLYVIDGFIGANIESISMNDIENIEILKDASATAIYGSRGSNGVVIITTKSGKSGKTRIDINPWFSKAEIPKKLHLMNAYQFATALNAQNAATGTSQAFTQEQLDAFKTNPGTDWQDAIEEKPWIQNYQINVSGGAPNVNYLFSVNYLDQPGLILNQYFKKAIFRSNVNFKISSKIDAKIYVNVLMPKSRNTGYAGDITDPFAQAFQWDPTSPIRDGSGNFILKSQYGSNATNPVAQATNQLDDNSTTYINGTGIITWRIIDGLTFTSNNTYDANSSYGQSLRGPETADGLIGNDYAQVSSGKSWSFQNSNFLTYNHQFGDHSVTLTALYEQHRYEGRNETSRSTNLSTYSLGYYNLGLGKTQKISSGYSADALQSYMGRINYSYKDKYLLTASVRSDGSSHLTKKYSTFPSVALGWLISKENFLSNSKVISNLKLRASWGITGNQAVPSYASIAQINTGPQGPNQTLGYYYDGNTLTIATSLGAPISSTLKWENDAETNLGLDAAFLKGRLTFTVDAYRKKITNLLYNYQSLFYIGGGQSYQRNLGSLENKGLEFALSGTPISSGKFIWTTNLTLSFNRNKVLNLGGLDSVINGNVGSAQVGNSILVVGEPLGDFFGFKYLGTWKSSEVDKAADYGMKPGDSKYVDVNGDHAYTPDDYMIIGNGNPKYSFGFINDFTYGNFSLSVMFQGTHGNQIYSGTFPYTFGGQGDARNATNADILNVWTPEHETDIPTFDPSSNNSIHSSRWVYDASYIKLKNLSLAYRLPQSLLSKAKISSLEVYVSGQNLFCITNYPGYDPEVTNANYGAYPALAEGLETGVIPNPRTYTIGLRVSF